MATEPAAEVRVELSVNDQPVEAVVPVRRLLADFLRDDLGLTGTHVGCEQGVCGACTVDLDGAPVRSCIVLAAQTDGASVRTVEGLAQDGALSQLQAAFREHHGLQCGFCTPGFLMTLSTIDPSDYPGAEGIREAASGNLCRCTGYGGILAAVESVWGEPP